MKTPSKSVREFCKQCVSSKFANVIKDCGGEMVLATKKPCALLKYRLKGRATVKAIRRNCVECMGGSFVAVEDCQTSDCPLYVFRMGRNPFRISRKSAVKRVSFLVGSTNKTRGYLWQG